MQVYQHLGVRPIINVCGTMTRYGGALMERSTLEAMNEAAKQSVCLDELQAAASKVIAQITHAEAGIVTAGASAALTLGAAACITGLDVAKMNRLPDTAGMPNEVLMPWHQISGYDHAIRAAGATINGVGIPNDTTPPYEVHIISRWDIESAITAKTVALAYAPNLGSHPPLEEVIEIGRRYHLPVIIDAAALVPPVTNLHKFIDMGAELVCFSGGKGILGPQASGILCGRQDLISSAVLQMLDMAGEPFLDWNPPASLIPKDKLSGKPQQGIGRGMKVSKETIIGLLTALQSLIEDKAKDLRLFQLLLKHIAASLQDIPGVETKIDEEIPGGHPILKVRLDELKLGRSAFEVSQKLKKDFRVYVYEKFLAEGLLIIHSLNLDEEQAKMVGQYLYRAITK